MHDLNGPQVLVNGVEVQQVSALDRGLLYGDGLFETIAVIAGDLQHWDMHTRRLQRGCQRLALPEPDFRVIREEAADLARGVRQGVLKIIWTRGSGERGYRIPPFTRPTRILALSAWPNFPHDWSTEGVTVRLCDTRLSRNNRLAGIKHLNRLEQVLARSEWQDPSIAEGLMFDTEGHVIEGTFTNLFLVIQDRLATPDLKYCGIEGITRERILAYAKNIGIEVRIADLDIDELRAAQEAFLCNTLVGIWPIRWLALDGMLPFEEQAFARELRRVLFAEWP